ncbi:accessory Sec system translocase SecA2 [Acetatifactor muris]|uniref:Protein translocase subunit SecA n=1 Tax=Acetatifactor muris TaxID=879566 RepID=A0A2K4ZEP3_9FIRM|nr:accessory Sec system translocase SecA2 [Acetatifactor muris]MCR2048545.1 accessory Sec system translocase SecA2 [Acetatifactor muris]SOY28937.1 preprotein translocase subunit SecA [Acetatifactor muris]
MKQRWKLRKLKKEVCQVRKCQERMKELSDEELSHLTVEFRERLAGGESLDDLLPEAFAAICEADWRILGMAPYDAQILGGIALHKGYLAEMNTGEGKTLVATMPLYLNALTGKSVILVTVNDYLARRDAEEMGPVYRFMGLSVSAGGEEDAGNEKAEQNKLQNAEKKEMYAADIVYTTHGALGFDYLLNNLVTRAEDRFLREFYYVIIDEADSVLLDGAQMPLVISSSPRVQSNLYGITDFFVTTMIEDEDYEQEDKAVWLTENGIRYAETFFQIDNFYSEEYFEINRHVTLALRAHAMFEKGDAYMVSKDGKVVLLDGGTGRLMDGMKLRGGQHQALEAKEGVEISQENRSVAAVTFQNLFLMFPKMAGMSGTMIDASEELRNVYGVKVLVIPPNRPRQRVDLPDQYFRNKEEQIQAAVEETLELHATGRPVLIVASNIVDTESVSRKLLEAQVPHNVLNANNASWEAQIIKEAGQPDAVTVATSMAGRGTDIKLGKGVEAVGGLAVIGIGRMDNVRMERQARGRAGRQGDVGSSHFFVSLEDGVVDGGNSKQYEKYIEGKRRISRRKLKKIIDKSQKTGEEMAVMSRKRSVDYDKIMRRQRDLIYATRDHLLDGGDVNQEQILQMAEKNIRRFFGACESIDKKILSRYILDNISYRLENDLPDTTSVGLPEIEEYLLEKVVKRLEDREKNLGVRDMNTFIRVAVLSAIDNAWVEQVDYMHQLQAAVSGRSTAQRNLLFEYQNECFDAFEKMENTVFETAMRSIMLSNVYVDAERKLHIVFP